MIVALLLASIVRFGIVSDTHVKDSATAAEMEKVFVRFRERGVDAVLHCGDLTNRGGADEFAEFAKAWKGAFAETGRLVVAFGNRDIAGAKRVSSDFGEVGVRSSCIGGVWVVAADCGHEGELEDHFRAHPEIGSSRGPIVTLQHKHHQGTIFGGRIADWMAGDERSTCWHRMFPNMVSFSGHSHVANLGDNAFWRGGFTAVAAGSCCFEKGTETGGREIAFLTLDGLKAELERVDLRTGRSVTNAFEIVWPKDSLATDGRAIVFRHWNIGHFSHGRSAATAIGRDESAARAADYRRELSRQEPDVLGFSEYDATFDHGGGRTRGILLDGWEDVDEGAPDGYQCNALAVRTGKLSNRRSAFYAVHTQKTHYTAAEVEVRGVRFVVVETHLDLGSPDLRRAQIAELLSAFANEPRVVVAGDFNVSDVSEYGPFAAAGYVAALPSGDGFLPTHRRRSLAQTPSIDNVFVRGFRFADLALGDYGMALSDHRSLMCALVPAERDAPVRKGRTKILFSFDTEDYTCDRSNDAIRDLANVLRAEGVRGNFNVVGYLAARLVELRRFDVIDALKDHVIGSQTLYHSRHPDLAELGDDPDYARAYRRTLTDEARAMGMLEAAFGEGRCVFWCPPGNSVSAVAMDVYSDMGVRISAGCGMTQDQTLDLYSDMLVRPGTDVGGLWYFNQYHAPYSLDFHLESMLPQPGVSEPDYAAALDKLARYDVLCLYMHPHMAVKTAHWDGLNYLKGNQSDWRHWKEAPDRDPRDTAVFYARLGAFVRRMKADPRFEITDFESLQTSFRPRVAIARKDLPAIRAALAGDFNSIRDPASWSVADVFQAVVRLLRGEQPTVPGKVYGFLSRPKGVDAETRISVADLRAAAARIDLSTFLPSEIRVGDRTIGPADFLFAALEALDTGAESVLIRPREQLGSFKEVPGLVRMNLAGKWVHTPEFKDAFLSERLRLQLWTLRIE